MAGFLKEGRYQYVDTGEIYEGKPGSIKIGAVPLEWDQNKNLVTDGAEITKYYAPDGREIKPI